MHRSLIMKIPLEVQWEILLYISIDKLLKIIENINHKSVLSDPNFQKYYSKHYHLRHGFIVTPYREGLWILDQCEGYHQTKFACGNVDDEMIFVHGLKSGPYRQYYIDGSLKCICIYINNELQGIKRTWHSNSIPEYEGEFIDGQHINVHRNWYPTGQLLKESWYVDGEYHGVIKSWFPNGILESESIYVHGKLTGISRRWYQNGQIESEQYYFNDKLSGESYEYYSNGHLRSKCNWICSYPLFAIRYDQNGIITNTVDYTLI